MQAMLEGALPAAMALRTAKKRHRAGGCTLTSSVGDGCGGLAEVAEREGSVHCALGGLAAALQHV